jgi:hypothetical protein
VGDVVRVSPKPYKATVTEVREMGIYTGDKWMRFDENDIEVLVPAPVKYRPNAEGVIRVTAPEPDGVFCLTPGVDDEGIFWSVEPV